MSRLVSCLAVLPLAFDAYILNIEHFLLAEPLFLALLTAALVLLLWEPRPGPRMTATVGMLLAAAALTRTVGQPLLAVVGLYLLVRLSRRSLSGLAVATYALTAVGVLAGYMSWYAGTHHKFGVTDTTSRFLYGRVQSFADCTRHSVPAQLQALCDLRPAADRPGLDWTGTSGTQHPRRGVIRTAIYRRLTGRSSPRSPSTSSPQRQPTRCTTSSLDVPPESTTPALGSGDSNSPSRRRLKPATSACFRLVLVLGRFRPQLARNGPVVCTGTRTLSTPTA